MELRGGWSLTGVVSTRHIVSAPATSDVARWRRATDEINQRFP